jgi:hypothetical protein
MAGDSGSRVVGNPAALIKVIRRSLRANAYAAGRLLLWWLLLWWSKAHRNHRGRLNVSSFRPLDLPRSPCGPIVSRRGGQLLMPLTNENG